MALKLLWAVIERKFSTFSLKFNSGDAFSVQSNLESNSVFAHSKNSNPSFLKEVFMNVPVPYGLQCKNQTIHISKQNISLLF